MVWRSSIGSRKNALSLVAILLSAMELDDDGVRVREQGIGRTAILGGNGSGG